jgi:feruloyl esterase
MTRRVFQILALLTLEAVMIDAPAASAASCEGLVALKLAKTTIKSATSVTAGPFVPPGAAPTAPPLRLPAFCRVVGVTAPTVTFEVWLPLQNWNGKFQGVGNGGTAGVISYVAMAAALTRGYATASTDTGHVNNGAFDSSWAIGRPELVADFGHRGLHVMTENGKRITQTFYEKRPAYSYFVGCSKGGQQGLMEAQRYPGDYDGIIAGAPANNWTRFYAGGHLWYSLATLKDPESYIPASKVPLLANAVTASCDALDGVAEGVLNDPRKCAFDPAVLACKPGQDSSTCFTPKQVNAVKDIWAGPRNSAGQIIYPGLVPGGEAGPGGWASWTTGTAPFAGARHWSAAEGFFKYMVFENPDWDFRTFNYDVDLPQALAKVSRSLDATDPNLRPFKRRGGKLIVYHGWSDPDISPWNAIDYYESVVSHFGGENDRGRALGETQDFFRLFMVPGMQHCSGGPGPDTFDMLTALEQWVEHNITPKVIATHLTNGVADRTRPLCAYPQVARWNRSGSTDDAANFVCVNEEEQRSARSISSSTKR